MHTSKFAPHKGIYLLSHSVGRPLVGSRESVANDFFEHWENGDAEVWPLWIEQIEGFREALASLLDARAKDFCPQVNLSSALCKVVHSLPRSSQRNVIVMSEQDFPSMGFVMSQAQRAGFEIRMIPTSKDSRDLNVWAQYLTDDVCCTLVTLVYSNSGIQLPLAEITQLARDRGIISIADICQAVGVVPINLQEWQADFVLGSCVKWLCGGPGAGFLWVNSDVVEQCQPVDVGWFSHDNPFEFDIHNFHYASGALRFWGGTPSVLPYVLAASSIRTMQEIGIEEIRAHNVALTEKLLNEVSENSVVSPRKSSHRGGTIVLNFGDQQSAIEQQLTLAKVRFDARATGIRLSPHIYNTAQEMDVLLDCFAQGQR
ncbi:MAG: selenocysteine lyase/cysteine desulfurase [Halioglobus sp.]|jgi:selenocysteine lyase/cysteine desulfurase